MFAKKILIPVTVIALLLSACTDSTDKPQADKSETSVISTTTKSESGQEPNISGFIKKAIKSGKADISAESTSDNEGAGSVITSEDISRMISWKGSFHRDNDDWSFEISKVSDMNISYKFESSENEVLTGTASFDQGGNSAFGKATSDKGFVLEIDKSDNSITIRGSEKLNGVWKKVSNLTMDDLAIDGIRLNMKYNEAAKLLGLKD
ncbi:MAG: hypothetical protein Q8920_11790, partial [Bacillota bacterium]|nr:hypothetical protein [Bacillota bacterium]